MLGPRRRRRPICAIIVVAAVANLVVPTEARLHALVMGDWGGVPFIPWTTPAEGETASAMGALAQEQNSSFAVVLGDNFYTHGVTDEHDKRFLHTFEDVFTHPRLSAQAGFKFKVCAGNHDHYGNVSAQIEYSKYSERWDFPALYHTWQVPVNDGTSDHAQFVLIDTIVLSEGGSASESQLAWLNHTLATSTASYLIVGGHFPVWSVCEHGPNSDMQKLVKPLLEQYNVQVYLSGHDHCEEHIVDPESDVQYHVVGAANQNQGSHKHKDSVPQKDVKFLDLGSGPIVHELEGGFASLNFDSNGLTVSHYRTRPKAMGSTQTMYEAPPIPKRPTRS